MEEVQKKQLQDINKLIFVQDYERAYSELNDFAKTCTDVTVQIRRIELALKLDRIKGLVDDFALRFKKTGLATDHALLVMCKQFGELQSSFDCVAEYQTILKSDPANVACYYGIAIAMEQRNMLDRAVYNYTQALQIDPEFFPAYFGLSQTYYHQENYERGDYFFYLFESAAPFNVYGNFETHRGLAREFIQREQYTYALRAASTLSSWWQENKGFIPLEILVFENLAHGEVSRAAGDLEKYSAHLSIAKDYADQLVKSIDLNDSIFYFVAKMFEDYTDDVNTVLNLFERILSNPLAPSELVQKIAGQMFSQKRFDSAKELFLRSYRKNPDHHDLRFCLLVARLKSAKVGIEEYLADKDRLNQLIASNADKVELLSLLPNLHSRFKEDPEVHAHLSQLFSRLGNDSKASEHIQKMHDLDPLGKDSILRYTIFLCSKQRFEDAQHQLDLLKNRLLDPMFAKEIKLVQIDIYQKQKKYAAALAEAVKLQKLEPWDLHLLLKQHHAMFHLEVADRLEYSEDVVLLELEKDVETKEKEWQQFDRLTEIYESHNLFDLVYLRRKIRFVFGYGKIFLLRKLLEAASRYEIKQGIHDFLHLINTNFDSPDIYWALGMLYKQMWQLETAISWFEQATQHPKANPHLIAEAYKEIADSYNWGNHNFDKAMEYGQLALNMQSAPLNDLHGVLAHAYIKQGKIRQARHHLEKASDSDIEAEFLRGLLCYRDGQQTLAKKHWKPLLTSQSHNIKIYHIKQEIHRYYFREQDYLKAN